MAYYRNSAGAVVDVYHTDTSYRSDWANMMMSTRSLEFRRRRNASISSSQRLTTHYFEQKFEKRECCRFVPVDQDYNTCGCGRPRNGHSAAIVLGIDEVHLTNERWAITTHTQCEPTDAFGTIEFQGGPHPHRAHYVRLGFDSAPSEIMSTFEKIWLLEPPKLVITVQGGIANFDLQPKLTRVFRKGLLKAAKTTGAWIITSGINSGVVRHVASALSDGGSMHRQRSRIVTIGIAPWGLLKRRQDFVGKDVTVQYHPYGFSPKGRFAVLNDKHSYFLLVDNGTAGRYGADIVLRKRLEEYLTQKTTLGEGRRPIPVVCVVLEGGRCTIRSVLDYVTNIPPVPVVVCDGSGRAADLLSFTHLQTADDGTFRYNHVKAQLVRLVMDVFGFSESEALQVVVELMHCCRKKHLVTIFRLGEDTQQDVDYAILTALLKGQELSAPDQLTLAQAWNRSDIATSDIFVLGQEWPPDSLEKAMMEALVNDRVDFVKLLLENGVQMDKFLTYSRLESLYNTETGPVNTLYYIVRGVKSVDWYDLPTIGAVIEKLMGCGYYSNYTTAAFKRRYYHDKLAAREARTTLSLATSSRTRRQMLSSKMEKTTPFVTDDEGCDTATTSGLPTSPTQLMDREDVTKVVHFTNPFNELFLWAVLTKRQSMARCMWQHGEEATCKALVAEKLYKSMAKEAAFDYLEVQICEDLKKYSKEFRKLAYDILDHCYQEHDEQTLQLLTCERVNWSKYTCLSLAVVANNKEFVAHPCCQLLLADLWHGGLRIRKRSTLKVILGILIPPTILWLDFKTKEELLAQPQNLEEHLVNLKDGDSGFTSDPSSDLDSDGGDIVGDPRGAVDGDAAVHDVEGTVAARHGQRPGHKRHSTSIHSVTATTVLPKRPINEIERLNRRLSTTSVLSVGHTVFVPEATPSVLDSKSAYASAVTQPQSACYIFGDQRRGLRTTAIPPEAQSLPAILPHNSDDDDGPVRHKQPRPLRWRKKLFEFYVAPISTFWAFTISYCIFMVLFHYVCLVKTPVQPTYIEWYLLAYCVSNFFEQIRKVMISHPENTVEKLKQFASRKWNLFNVLMSLLFFIAFSLRCNAATAVCLGKPCREWGRVLMVCDCALWLFKLYELLSVHPRMGIYITLMGKMVKNMAYMVTILVIQMSSFGLIRQGITFPNENFNWVLVSNIFHKPYFMLYGEVYAAEIDTCNQNNTPGEDCVTGYWVPPLYMVVFMLVANILLINLLIAIFNDVYQGTMAVSEQMWLFQRYEQVMEFEAMPFLPPPFTVFAHLWLIVKYVRTRCHCKRGCTRTKAAADKQRFDVALKLFLDADQVELLNDFEEDCMDDLQRAKEFEMFSSTNERIHRSSDKVEFVSMKLNDLMTGLNHLKASVHTTMEKTDENVAQILQLLQLQQAITKQQQSVVSQISALQTTAELELFDNTVAPNPVIDAQTTSPFVVASDGFTDAIVVSRRHTVAAGGRSAAQPTADATLVLDKRAELHLKSLPDVHLDCDERTAEAERDLTIRISKDDLQPQPSIEMVEPVLVQRIGGRKISLSPAATSGRCRRNDEYTSITDAITIVEPVMPEVLDTIDEHLKNDKPSFIVKQNEMLREFEETSSRITGGLIEDRIRHERHPSATFNEGELRGMGLNDSDVKDYIDALQRTTSNSGSDRSGLPQEWLNRDRLVDSEGFHSTNGSVIGRTRPINYASEVDGDSSSKLAAGLNTLSRRALSVGTQPVSACVDDDIALTTVAGTPTRSSSSPLIRTTTGRSELIEIGQL